MLFSLLVVVLAGAGAQAQAPQANTAVTEVRESIAAARKELDADKTAGGAAAIELAAKWDAALWAYRERYPRSEASTLATTEAVRLLVRAELWDRAQARVESVQVDDPAWTRLPSVVYEIGIARKDLPSVIDRLTRAAESTTVPANKAAALMTVGRAHRRQGDKSAATRSFEAVKAAAPDSPQAKEAEGLIYEISFLSPGLPAPAIAAKARNGRTINLAALRGKPVVLVFWGTT